MTQIVQQGRRHLHRISPGLLGLVGALQGVFELGHDFVVKGLAPPLHVRE